jgi:HAD superfamily hydrolase (TIGR01509 family)
MPEAILFDFDGVLADSEPLHHACWSQVLAPHGVALTWDTYAKHCVGVADRDMIEFLCTLHDPPLSAERLFAEYPLKKRLFAERIREDSPIPHSTREFLRALDGFKLAVVSSSGRAEIEPMLTSAGVRDLFQAVVCGEDVQRLKPAPDPYLEAARLLGISTALVVEDSEAGVASGRAAGFDVLRVSNAAAMPAELRARLGL